MILPPPPFDLAFYECLERMLDGLATVDGLAPDSRALITLAAQNGAPENPPAP